MPGSGEDDERGGARQVVLVLRLVLDRQARLHHGELLDADATRQGRFSTMTELTEAVDRWMTRQQDVARLDETRLPTFQ